VRRMGESESRDATVIPEARETRREPVDRRSSKRGEKHAMKGTPRSGRVRASRPEGDSHV
jgi:hypothetical protein